MHNLSFLEKFANACLPEVSEKTKQLINREVEVAIMYIKNGHNEPTVVYNALNAVERFAAADMLKD